MLIILEGPDGSGKTTLAQELASHLSRTTSDKVEVWHAGPPTRHPLDEYLTPVTTYRPGTGYHLILDRWHWGERVYPRVLGRPSELDDAIWWSIEAYLRRLGALVVLCDWRSHHDYLDVYRERRLDGTPDFWQLTKLEQIRNEFSRMVYYSQLSSAYAWTPGQYVHGIVESARHYEERYRHLNGFTTYLGPVKPHTLLFGDVRNGRDPATSSDLSPAFVPYASTSGHFLLKSLAAQTSRTWPSGIGLANACDVDDPVDLWRVLGEPPVVALGKNAYGKLIQSGFTCGVVPHPQYVRRFHHKFHREYGWKIVETSRTGRDNSKWQPLSTESTDAASTPTS